MKHTPGPWKINQPKNDGWQIFGNIKNPQAYPICTYGFTGGESEANANLIAAAPDLMEAAKAIIENMLELGPQCRQSYVLNIDLNKLQNAIVKAEGE